MDRRTKLFPAAKIKDDLKAKTQIAIVIISIFGFIAAFAWNDTASAIFNRVHQNTTPTILAHVIYSVLITLISISAIVGISYALNYNINADELERSELGETNSNKY